MFTRTAKIYPQTRLGSGFPLFSPAKSKAYLLSCNSIRVSDAWSFLSYTIRVSKHRTTGHLLTSDQQKFLLDLLEQAKFFYETALGAPIKSQPLLYYYSFMNIVKIAFNLDRFEGNAKKYTHGITENITATSKLFNATITLWATVGSKISNSEYLFKLLEDPLPSYTPSRTGRGSSFNVQVINLLRDCVGINRTYSEIVNVPEHFYRITNYQCYSQRNKLFFKGVVSDCDDAAMAVLQSRGYNIIKDGCTYYLTVDSYVKTTPSPTIAEWHNLSKRLRSLGLWSYMDGKEYKLYISTQAQKFSSPSIIYHVMFFLGSITRYHPDMFDSILTAKEYWLVSEFLRTQPQQFLYYMLSLINGAEVLFSKQV